MARSIAGSCTANRIRQATRLLTRTYDDALRPLGIQTTQLMLLVAVAHFDDTGAPMGRLATLLVMDQTTMSRNVVPLEKAGLVRVARAPNDARARVVVLTRAGEQMIATAYPLWEAAQKKIRRAVGADRLAGLHDALAVVIASAGILPSGGPKTSA